MTAALTIGPDGVARIEIVIKLDITVKTEEVPRAGSEHGSGDRPGGEARAGSVGVVGGGDEGDSAGVAADDRAGTDDPPAPADGMGASPVDVALEPVAPEPAPAPLPPPDEEPQPAAEAGGEPTLAETAGAAAPAQRAKRPARKTGAVTPDQLSRREIAIAAYQRGATFFEAGREARVSHVTVGNWVREAGLPVRLGAWKRPPKYSRTASPTPAAPAAPEPAAATEPARPVTPSPRRPAPRPLTGDEAAIAEAIATGRVTRVPDASAFAKLPAIVGINHARSVLESAGATVRRAGSGWDVDGRKVSNQGLIQAAQAAQRQALLERSVPA